MSNWCWRVIAIKAIFIITFFASYLRADETIQKLPFCNPDTATSSNSAAGTNDLVIVSTLDGKITAFITANGVKAWDLQTQPLLSSNLHPFELTSGGKWVRLVPSLRGTLYSVSGDTIEQLPFDADQLLSSSFKYSEDLVIAGARETRWTGVEASSGDIVYECTSRGCSGEREAVAAGRQLLVLRRNSNTVRALDPHTGAEKWNFSVSEHHLALSGTECIGRAPPPALAPDYTIDVAVPEGVVGVKTTGEPPVAVWQHKLEAPVANMWRLRGGTLQNIDVLWAASKSLTADSFVQITPPSLYIGLHDQQLYVQEGLLYAEKMSTAVASRPVPWKIKQSRPLLTGPETALSNLQNSDPNTLALITLYGSTGQGSNHGYFLYNDETCDPPIQITEEDPDIFNSGSDNESEHHHVHVHVYSLWFWWKEVLLIAISSALLMNLMIWPRFFAPRPRPPSPLPINQEYIVVEKHYDRTPSNSSQNYVGRYETDFSPVRCLGRGGFGVVFEAKNNIDHCSYAVKRITLPRRESKRERVLREVRALAKLEHENIVRYFNAWLEEPPPMWQEERDALWIRELDGVSLQMTEDYTSPKDNIESPSPLSPSSKSQSDSKNVVLNMNKCQWEKSIDAAINGLDVDRNEGTKRIRSLSCNDSLSITFEEPVKSCKKDIGNSLDVTIDRTLPKNFSLSKNVGSGDNDDSFIVFAQPEGLNHNSKGLSATLGNISKNGNDRTIDKCNGRSSHTNLEKKRKKGHTRHWSLDMCVKSTDGNTVGNGGTKMYLYIQMQLCRRDSLHDWLRNNRTFEARGGLANSLFSQIVSAVEYVHLAGLIHRDLKPSNIFFAPDGKVKVGDFGLVTAMGDNSPEATPEAMDVQARHTYRVGTHLYMSPEQMEGRTYNYKVDIYSLGLILFELLYPFGTESERIDCLLQLRRGHYPKMFQIKHPNEMEVLKLMLSKEPTERPTASGVRARAPLYQCTDERYHFCLPHAI